MLLSAIAAISEERAIGRDNQLPWYLPGDLKFFKQTTLGKPVVMGRKTYESLGKPLPGRLNVVLSSQENYPLPEGVLLAPNLKEGIAMAQRAGTEEVFVIGGGKVFEEAMPLLDTVYLTRVAMNAEGADVFFPVLEERDWQKVWEEPHSSDEKNEFAYSFQRWERRRP